MLICSLPLEPCFVSASCGCGRGCCWGKQNNSPITLRPPANLFSTASRCAQIYWKASLHLCQEANGNYCIHKPGFSLRHSATIVSRVRGADTSSANSSPPTMSLNQSWWWWWWWLPSISDCRDERLLEHRWRPLSSKYINNGNAH